MAFSLVSKQRECVVKMLHFNEEEDTSAWKIFVYDKFCNTIMTHLMNLGELRRQNVTLHLYLEQKRDKVPDVPAVYFVTPTEENVSRICADLANGLYESIHVNFSSSVPRVLLEKLASESLANNWYMLVRFLSLCSAMNISRVYDQYTHFVSLQASIFSFNLAQSFLRLQSPLTPEKDLMQLVDSISESLMNVCVTLGQVPIIRCQSGGAAEHIASKLEEKLRNLLQNSKSLFPSSIITRPVLVLVDRTFDMAVALHHTWTYQALIHDLLKMSGNRVRLEVKDKGVETIDIDPSDPFFSSLASLSFQDAAETVDKALNEYKNEIAEVSKKSGVEPDNLTSSSSGVSGLEDMIKKVPVLQEKKKRVDTHLKLLTAILDQLKTRKLDQYYSLEEDLLSRGTQDAAVIRSQLASNAEGTPFDKLRLYLMYILTCQVSKAESEECEKLLTELFPNDKINSINFVKKLKAVNSFASSSASINRDQPSSSSAAASTFQNIFGSIVSTTTGIFAGVKNILPASKELALTRLVNLLMSDVETSEFNIDKYAYFDPKLAKRPSMNSKRPQYASRDAIVFVLGGGNYVEYQNLQDFCVGKDVGSLKKNVIYGSTEIITPDDFLEQLTSLGKENSK